jgi:hypothetical protein
MLLNIETLWNVDNQVRNKKLYLNNNN